jgi:membrane-associated HD superfamily phosphohydrolase
MLKNSQFSHILLLCAIAYVIYCLTCPKTIKNTGTLEQINSSDGPVKSESQVSAESTISEVKSMVESEEQSSVQSESPVSQGIVSEVDQQMKQPSNEVHSFKADETKGGADLNAAFVKPIPKGAQTNAVNFNKDYLKKYDSKSYLPQEVNDEWFDTDFSQAKKNVKGDKLINTDKYIVGIDTVGQSLKNASHDIRGTIANPKYNVSPWLNSTYEPDYNIKPLC